MVMGAVLYMMEHLERLLLAQEEDSVERWSSFRVDRYLGGVILIIAGVFSPTGAAAAHLLPPAMVRAYFADLNAHRYQAAWRLEAPCGVTFSIPNGPGAPIGSGDYPGRGAWQPAPVRVARHPILASAPVTTVTPLHIPILARNHILAFGVSGWYTFDYSLVPWLT